MGDGAVIPAHLEDAARLQASFEAAGGIIDVFAVEKADRIRLLCLALDGEPTAVRLIESIQAEDTRVARAPRASPARCAGCRRKLLHRVRSVVVATPLGADDAITASVCSRCSGIGDATFLVAELLLRQLWPDALLRRADLPREVAQ